MNRYLIVFWVFLVGSAVGIMTAYFTDGFATGHEIGYTQGCQDHIEEDHDCSTVHDPEDYYGNGHRPPPNPFWIIGILGSIMLLIWAMLFFAGRRYRPADPHAKDTIDRSGDRE